MLNNWLFSGKTKKEIKNCFNQSHFPQLFFLIEVHFIYSKIRGYHRNGLMNFDRCVHLCHLPTCSVSEEENKFLFQIHTQEFGYLTYETLGWNQSLFCIIIL